MNYRAEVLADHVAQLQAQLATATARVASLEAERAKLLERTEAEVQTSVCELLDLYHDRTEQALARAERAEAVLREVEWATLGYCPKCHGYKSQGHEPVCPLAAAIRPSGALPQAEQGGASDG